MKQLNISLIQCFVSENNKYLEAEIVITKIQDEFTISKFTLIRYSFLKGLIGLSWDDNSVFQ